MQYLMAIIGLQFGDEGKGKIVDWIVDKAIKQDNGKRTVVVRFQGGTNAGHTIYVRDEKGELIEFITHAAPSGLTSNADIAIGPHVAFDPEKFMVELNEAKKIFNYSGNIMISERVGILMEYHRKLDAWKEKSERAIGTTKSGIGPFYSDNANRSTRLTFNDYVSPNFKEKLKKIIGFKKSELLRAGIIEDDTEECINEYLHYLLKIHDPIREELSSYKERLEYRLNDYFVNGDNIIVEGAQGSLLDVDMGTIPDITSSHLLAPHAFPGLGLPRSKFKIYGIEKIYPTRVGEGELPTLDESPEFGNKIVSNAGEFGATTGRQRRVGYPDWVMVKRSVMLNDCDGIFLTRADCLQGIDIKACTSYVLKGEEEVSELPLDFEDIIDVKYSSERYNWRLWEGMDNLSKPLEVDKLLREKRKEYVKGGFDSFPEGMINYVKDHDEFIGCKIVGVSVGPGRMETVTRDFN